MHGYRAGQGAARARVLYMFRTPPNMQIGRKSLDAEVREALEHTHPDLTFDWAGLLREPMPPARIDPRERGPRQRSQGRKERPARESGPPEPPPPVVIEDDSLLGRTVGGAEAARLRARFAELNHRIARRARTPEERERLGEAAQRLNPDGWTDEASIRAGMVEMDAQCEAIVGELPRRRRGRRGGKAPDRQASGDVIIGQRDESDERNDDPDTEVADVPDQPTPQLAVADPVAAADGGDDQRTTSPSPGGGLPDDDAETDVR